MSPALNQKSYSRKSLWERIVAVCIATIIVFVVLYLLIRNTPIADPNLVIMIRTSLSVASGILGATIPGFLNISLKGAKFGLRAGGGCMTKFFTNGISLGFLIKHFGLDAPILT